MALSPSASSSAGQSSDYETTEAMEQLNLSNKGDLNRGRPLNSGEEDGAPRGQLGSCRGRADLIGYKAEYLVRTCKLYLGGFPGADNLANNTGFHTTIRKFIKGDVPITEENLDGVFDMIMYRIDLASLAQKLLALTSIPLPNGKDLFELDLNAFGRRLSPDANAKSITAWQNLKNGGLLPPPKEDDEESQGRPWEKPNWYIAAALALDPSIKDKDDIEKAIDRMRLCY